MQKTKKKLVSKIQRHADYFFVQDFFFKRIKFVPFSAMYLIVIVNEIVIFFTVWFFQGKGLFALRQFKEGDLILTEKPILCCQFSWNTDYGYLACDNCMLPLETAEENARRLTGKSDLILPYGECCETKKEQTTECPACGIKYCSTECLNEAYQKYHQTLCLQSRDSNESHPLNLLKETWKQIYYPPETATIMLLARMVAYVNQSADKSAALATFAQFCHRTVNEVQEIAHNLLGEKFVGQIDVLRQAMENALNAESAPHVCKARFALDARGSACETSDLSYRLWLFLFFQWFTPDGFRSLLALVGTNGQGIGTSAFGRWVKHVSALELPEDRRIQIDKFIDRLYDDMDEGNPCDILLQYKMKKNFRYRKLTHKVVLQLQYFFTIVKKMFGL